MAEANDKYGIIYQNLVDAGCNQKTIQCCMKLAQENNVEALLSQLCMYRKHLMEQTHIYQDNIDCLDCLNNFIICHLHSPPYLFSLDFFNE